MGTRLQGWAVIAEPEKLSREARRHVGDGYIQCHLWKLDLEKQWHFDIRFQSPSSPYRVEMSMSSLPRLRNSASEALFHALVLRR